MQDKYYDNAMIHSFIYRKETEVIDFPKTKELSMMWLIWKDIFCRKTIFYSINIFHFLYNILTISTLVLL